MSAYKKWANKKSPNKEMLTEEEVDSLENEQFPIWYVSFAVLYVMAMVGVAVGLLLACYHILNVYPEWILSDKEYIAVSTNPWGMYLMLPAFLPGILLGGLVLTPIALLFPRFERYIYKSQLKQGIKAKPSQDLTRRYIKWTSISLAVFAPFLLMAADNYWYVDENALHYNTFLGISESTISLQNLKRVEFGAWPNNGRNEGGINWEYVLVFNDGERFNCAS